MKKKQKKKLINNVIVKTGMDEGESHGKIWESENLQKNFF
jgi:hypothetical protein